jgi:hypothetical protein
MQGLDSVIISEYVKLNVPADQIVTDPAIAGDFRKAVNSHLPKERQVDQATLNKRLLNLRRRGEDNGGLPRQKRRYNGRRNRKPR